MFSGGASLFAFFFKFVCSYFDGEKTVFSLAVLRSPPRTPSLELLFILFASVPRPNHVYPDGVGVPDVITRDFSLHFPFFYREGPRILVTLVPPPPTSAPLAPLLLTRLIQANLAHFANLLSVPHMHQSCWGLWLWSACSVPPPVL